VLDSQSLIPKQAQGVIFTPRMVSFDPASPRVLDLSGGISRLASENSRGHLCWRTSPFLKTTGRKYVDIL
jgi:hypothetical protein